MDRRGLGDRGGRIDGSSGVGNPADAVTTSSGSPAGAGRAARTVPTSQTAVAATANDAASITKAAPTPMIAIAKPATAGPTVPISCWVPWSAAFAAPSCSSGTSRATIVLIAGKKNASTVPNEGAGEDELPDLDPRAQDERRR